MPDNKKTVICPNCGVAMKKIYIEEYNFYIDVCLDGCGGIWFDNRELKKFDEECESIDSITKIYENKTFPVENTEKTINCPACNSVMVKLPTNFQKSAIIDTCYSCGGSFINYGELEKIRNSNVSKEQFEEEFAKQNEKFLQLTETDADKKFYEISGRKERINFFYNLVQFIRK